jgi:hypothetical protein
VVHGCDGFGGFEDHESMVTKRAIKIRNEMGLGDNARFLKWRIGVNGLSPDYEKPSRRARPPVAASEITPLRK